MSHIKRSMQEGDPKLLVSTRMRKEPCGSRIDLLCQKRGPKEEDSE
jgi:hypothetical protein